MVKHICDDIINAELNLHEKNELKLYIDSVLSLEGPDDVKAEIIYEEKVKMEIIALSRKLLRGASSDNYFEVKTALELGADINTKSEFGNTALILAANRRNLRIVRLLLSYPEIYIDSVNQCGDTALKIAKRNGDEEIAINISHAKLCQETNNEENNAMPIQVKKADCPMNKIDHSRCYE